jgi:hypothetical protein
MEEVTVFPRTNYPNAFVEIQAACMLVHSVPAAALWQYMHYEQAHMENAIYSGGVFIGGPSCSHTRSLTLPPNRRQTNPCLFYPLVPCQPNPPSFRAFRFDIIDYLPALICERSPVSS